VHSNRAPYYTFIHINDEHWAKRAALRWESIASIAPLLLTVVVACHAERPPTPARPTVERRAAAQPAVEPPAPEHAADDKDEIRRAAKRPEYAAFFDTLKRKVYQSWDPISVWRRVDPKGTVYGTRTRVTEVRVGLSRSGEVAKIDVTSPSGVMELDDEAVRAFRSAAPFPAPPEGLIRKDDLLTFPFSFFFDTGGSHVKSMTNSQLESGAAVNGSKMPLSTSPCTGEYTSEARAAATEGVVVLDLIVDELGRTRDITVVEGLPHGLNESAIAALRACRFTPGEKDGRPVPVRVRGFKVRFLLDPTQ
jgi:TonB family protein